MGLILLFFLGILVAEIVGYVWHRFVEHGGVLGNAVRKGHWLHHVVYYPPRGAMRYEEYKDAHSWSWYAIGAFVLVVLFLFLPPVVATAVALGAISYAYLLDYIHMAFHTKNHWLDKYAWFREILQLHLTHHYEPVNFGIIFYLQDKLFSTYAAVLDEKVEKSPVEEMAKKLFPGY